MLRPAALALAALVCWNAAFAASGALGVWLPIALAAVGLDILAVVLLPRPDLGLSKRALAWALGATAVQVAATYLLYRPVLSAWPALRTQVAGLFDLLGHPTGTQVALLVFVVLSEELIYRGALQGLLARSGRTTIGLSGPWASAALAVVVYSLAHVASGSWALVGFAAVCGAWWGALRVLSGGLLAPIACHLVWDVAVLVLWPLEIAR